MTGAREVGAGARLERHLGRGERSGRRPDGRRRRRGACRRRFVDRVRRRRRVARRRTHEREARRRRDVEGRGSRHVGDSASARASPRRSRRVSCRHASCRHASCRHAFRVVMLRRRAVPASSPRATLPGEAALGRRDGRPPARCAATAPMTAPLVQRRMPMATLHRTSDAKWALAPRRAREARPHARARRPGQSVRGRAPRA